MKILQFILPVLFFISCKKNDDTSINSNNSQPSPPSKLLLLRVDYLTKAFEGGIELPLGGKIITFKNLRKTFMTSALREFGVTSTALTNHTSISMTNKHYYDKEVTRDEAKQSFSVFKKEKINKFPDSISRL